MSKPPFGARLILAALPFAALFIFPWKLTLALSFIAGLVYPPIPLIVGALIDILYYPGAGWLYGLTWGLILAILTYVVRYIAQTRIM